MNAVGLALIVLWLLGVSSGRAPGPVIYVLPILAVVLFLAGWFRRT